MILLMMTITTTTTITKKKKKNINSEDKNHRSKERTPSGDGNRKPFTGSTKLSVVTNGHERFCFAKMFAQNYRTLSMTYS